MRPGWLMSRCRMLYSMGVSVTLSPSTVTSFVSSSSVTAPTV